MQFRPILVTAAAIVAAGFAMLLSGSAAANPRAGEPALGARGAGFLFGAAEAGDRSLQYALYVPRAYYSAESVDQQQTWPLVVFLHGMGECGNDGQKMIAQGLGNQLLWNADRWPCLVLMPQKPTREGQWEDYGDVLLALIRTVKREFRIDAERIALTGLSHGGHGAWALAAKYPQQWSAVAPVCGRIAPLASADIAPHVKDLPIWCFHGGKDDVVAPANSDELIAAVRAAGGDPKYTLYPDANHNSWDKAYSEPDLPNWLLSQRRKTAD